MAIRFSKNGPAFPDALVDDMLEGKVVFLCGAGVSSPQLPGFEELAQKTYVALGADQTPAEAVAFNRGRFEEMLGSLSRRMSDPLAVQNAVSDLLKISDPDLSHHTTLLRLSRDLVGRPTMMTTNFDTLFEQAYEAANTKGSAMPLSLAEQALPPPGGADFYGIIHLHGRMPDDALGLAGSPLVMTSAQYGDAYMRSAWASRFLFDLARCRTIVLVGYQAGDAPVRYFLNVLAADRERFEDVQDVYALDGYDGAPESAGNPWDTVSVKPLMFQRATTGDRYKPLWDDLAALAALVDRPRSWRTTRAEALLSRPLEFAGRGDLELLDWLLRDKRDLWDVAIQAVSDPRWFDHFTAQKLWTDRDAAWVLSAWCAKDWSDRSRLDNAVGWMDRFGTAFAEAIDQRMASNAPADTLYFRAWRAIVASAKPKGDLAHLTYWITGRIKSDRRSDKDLRDAIRVMRPRLVAGVRYGRDEKASRPPSRLSDLLSFRLDVDSRGGLPELMKALLEHGDAGRIVEIATEELRVTIETATEAELILPGFDRLDDAIPTVEAHGQNKYRNGVVFLVQLMTEAYKRLAATDRDRAREAAGVWKGLGSRIGRRLWLQAMRLHIVYSADEVAVGVAALSKADFWAIRHELILAMAERLKDADPKLVETITLRILTEAPTLYEDLGEPSSGQTDWRPLVRDRDAWLRLQALRRAKRLSSAGLSALKAIQAQNSSLSRDYEESDLFASFSSGVSFVSGNPEPLKKVADPKKRLDVAKTLASAWDPNGQHSWSAYCSVDPVGALESLQAAPLSVENAELWNGLLGPLAWPREGPGKGRKQRQAVTLEAFSYLDGVDGPFLEALSSSLVDLLPRGREAGMRNPEMWWDRLWSILERAPADEIDDEDGDRFADLLINRPAGRLAEALITEISARKTPSRRISPANRARLRRMMGSDTQAGWYARGVAAQQAGFLYFVDPRGVTGVLSPWLSRDDRQGRTLRSVLVEWSSLGDKATAALKHVILRGARESRASSPLAAHVAARMIQPLFRDAIGKGPATPTITVEDVRSVLKQAAPSILEGAAQCLADWVAESGRKPENAWNQAIGPIFRKIWPQERTHRKSLYTQQLAKLCINSGGRFPEALTVVSHFLLPFEGDWAGLYFLSSTEAPDCHPSSTLQLLWILCGPGFEGQTHDLHEILARIRKADPALELDRRFQWLEQRASSF